MDKETIIELRKEANKKVQLAQLQLEQAKGTLRAIQSVCDHPDREVYYAMGERGEVCPDCLLTIS